VEELRKEQTKRRAEDLKARIGELNQEKLEQQLKDLERTLEELKARPQAQAVPLLMPAHHSRPLPAHHSRPQPIPLPMPTPDSGPRELPSPREGMVLLTAPADAALYVNGQRLGLLGSFLTPDLTPGKVHRYDFRLEVLRDGKVEVRSQRIQIRAGETVLVEFDKMPLGGRNETTLPVKASNRSL